MQIKYDDIELPLSRVKELEVSLDMGDSVLLHVGTEEVQVKFVDNQWRVFCSSNLVVDGSSSVLVEYSV